MAKSNYNKFEGYGNLPAKFAEKKENELTDERQITVYKSNKLIRDFRANMTLSQFRLANYIIAVAYTQKDVTEINIDAKRYCEVCGIDCKSGYNYEQIKADIKRLSDRSMWVEAFGDPNTEVLVRLINKSWANKRSGVIRIRLDEDVKQYVMALAQQYNGDKSTLYTKYTFLYTLPMRSMYSMRLYELLKSWEKARYTSEYGKDWTIDELQTILGSDYKRYQDFRRKVIEKAIEEINEHTDIIVTYEPIKEGRTYTSILFNIYPKSDDQLIKTQSSINWYLNVLRDTEREKKKQEKKIIEVFPDELTANADGQTAFSGCEGMPEPPKAPKEKPAPKKRGRPRKNKKEGE